MLIMNFYNILGYIGMVLIVSSLIPQLIKTQSRKKVGDISIFFPLLQVIACSCMIPYAIYIKSNQMLVIQIAVGTNSLFLLRQIIMYRRDGQNDIIPEAQHHNDTFKLDF